MTLPRAIEGARNKGLSITWTTDDGTAQNLTAATITGTLKDKTGTVTAITGTLTATDASNGVFSWAYSAADVATPGLHLVVFKATYTNYDLTYPEVWIVEPAQVVA
jgi:hypothetical protein